MGERMLNVPIVITHAIHQQLSLDLKWAVENNNPSFDFGLLVRIAPCYPSQTSASSSTNNNITTPVYKYFDDEIFATNSEFFYALPKSYSDRADNVMSYTVIILSVTSYKKSID